MSDGGSDGSPPQPTRRKIKKVMIVSSASESDSDESVVALSTRRKRMRVLSDDGASSSSSGGSAVVARRKRTLPALRDSGGDSDSSGWGTDRSDSRPAAATQPVAKTSGFSSDSSEGNSDKCSICLLRFKDQQVGTPETCEHLFCLDCITEWSRNVNTCPVDRMTFNAIVVRSCAGGRVLRTEPVKVAERRPSVDALVVEDPTPCEICGSTENEESMLLCDGCDLGFHMQCLTPPLTEVPPDQWLCPNCDDLLDVIHISELDDLFSGLADLDLPDGPRAVPLREARNVRRSSRHTLEVNEPSTSRGLSGSVNFDIPSTSRGSRSSRSSRTSRSRATTRRRTTGVQRRKHRRRQKTVVIEFEVESNGKFPITTTVRKTLRKRRSRKRVSRTSRTAARRQHVRNSVRARLAEVTATGSAGAIESRGSESVQSLSISRQRAGIPSLSLFGDPYQLEYFSDADVSEGATTAVSTAARPTCSVISAYRQARRKMVSVPSPPAASSAPDILSNILESQSLLHSKKSVLSVTVDGQLDIKLQGRDSRLPKRDAPSGDKKDDRLDLTKGEDASRKAPSYGGSGGGGGRGWGGGYRGGRVPPAAPSAHFPPSAPHAPHPAHRSHPPYRGAGDHMPTDYGRRMPYPPDDMDYDWRRENGRDRNYQPRARYSFGGAGGPPSGPGGPSWRSNDRGPPLSRHSFGGMDSNPLDMRTGGPPPAPQPPPQPLPRHQFGPLPQPPAFHFDKPDENNEEEENADLVIDTDKYDPTEPTNDDESGDEEPPPAPAPGPRPPVSEPAQPAPAPDQLPLPKPPTPPPLVQTILSDLNATGMDVPSNVLDSAVRQVLQEHRFLPAKASATTAPHTASDEDSDGDCPNFSIYSATSVHIASTSNLDSSRNFEDNLQRSKEDEYKEKVSKRCPITTNTRNPIKIKLNTSSLIKRMSLYDDEDAVDNVGAPETTPEPAAPDSSKKDEDEAPVDEAPLSDHQEDVEMREPSIEETSETGNEDLGTEDFGPPDVGTPKRSEIVTPDLEEPATPETPVDESATPDQCEGDKDDEGENGEEDKETDAADEREEDDARAATPLENGDKTDDDRRTDEERDDTSEKELRLSPCKKDTDDGLEKMTESISETEDERSYTPCLDENKSKDTSLETDKDKGIEGLDTEMISEEEANDMFSEEDKQPPSPPEPRVDHPPADDGKKKKKKESKKEGKDKKSKKKNEISFKKLSKNGKERNYRDKDKDKDKEKNKKERKSSEERKRRKEKRKDLERYDVRTVVSEKRKRVKDAFGRDVSPRRGDLSPNERDPSTPRRRTVSPRRRSISPRKRSVSLRKRSITPRRRSGSPRRRSITPRKRSISPRRRSITPRRRSISPRRRSISPRRRSISPRRRSISLRRRSISPRRRSPSLRRKSITPRRKSITPRRKTISPRRKSISPRRRSVSRGRKRRSTSRRKRRRSATKSPKPKSKKKKRARSGSRAAAAAVRRASPEPRKKSPKRKRREKRSVSPAAARLHAEWSPPSVDSRLLSPRTPPARPSPPLAHHERPRRHHRHAHAHPAGPSKEVFTSGDNILVSVSFKDQERDADVADKRKRREAKRDKRRKRRRQAAAAEADTAKPVAIIDLERSPFRELTPSPKNVIVLSDSDHGDKESEREQPAAPTEQHPHVGEHAHVGPKTPPEPPAQPVKFTLPPKPAPAPRAANPLREDAPADEANTNNSTVAPAGGGGVGPATPPDSPDAYDPFEPTRSASASPSPPPAARPPPADTQPRSPRSPRSPARAHITLEGAQKTNMSADDVIDRRPISPIEKVMALLQSTRDVSPEPVPGDAAHAHAHSGPAPEQPPAVSSGPGAAAAPAAAPAPAPRIVLPEPARSMPPKLFLAKPSPIKSNPVKPMQATKISRLPLPIAVASRRSADDDSPYSPGSSDFGDLFEPPGGGGGAAGAGANKPSRKDTFDSLFGDGKPNKRRNRSSAAKVPVKLNRKKGKTQVGVKIDEDNLKILDDLPSSAVEMQVKSKFLKKLNRQERVVEEVKLVLKPHYNKKHVTKDEYKEILRRTVPKICHNKAGEINPTKIQALVEAYVKKFRKKHKLGLA